MRGSKVKDKIKPTQNEKHSGQTNILLKLTLDILFLIAENIYELVHRSTIDRLINRKTKRYNRDSISFLSGCSIISEKLPQF